ncbi:MAG: hypothetical protein AB1515_08720, partial [Nitrospirota bacterium]
MTGPAAPNGEQTISTTWFHQGNDTAVDTNVPWVETGYMKGKPYKVRVTDEQGRLYSETTTSYVPAGAAPYFTPPLEVTALTCEAGANCRQARMGYGDAATGTSYYDAYGNLLQEHHYGDPTDASDDRTVLRSFAINDTAWIVGLPRKETIREGIGFTGLTKAETLFHYDGATDPTALPDKGHLTKLERWLDKPAGYLATTMTYDSYGNLLTTTDARGYTTTICYDAAAIFPQKTTNALGHIARTDYYGVAWNPACGAAPASYAGAGLWGQVKSVTDANGQQSTTQYDTFGRTVLVTNPDGGTTTTEYLNVGDPTLQRTRTVTADGSQDGLWSESYFDGLGRTYKSLAKGPNGTPIRQDMIYNNRGLVDQQSLPYFDGTEPPRYT